MKGLVGPLLEFLLGLRIMRSHAGTELRDKTLWKPSQHDPDAAFFHMCGSPSEDYIVSLPQQKIAVTPLPLHFVPERRWGTFWARAEAILGAANNRSDLLQFVSHYENSRHEHNKRTEWGHLLLFMSSKTGEIAYLQHNLAPQTGAWGMVSRLQEDI